MAQSLARGIDLSQHNGAPNFDKIKASGVEFVMIRMGYGGDSTSQDDTQFARSVAECERVGLPWGAYLYSYALNLNDAKSELNHILRLLKGKNPKYPVYLDMEDADGYKAKHGMPSNDVLVDICDTVLSGLEAAGYYAGLYAGLSWLEHQLAGTKLDKYDKWVAQWASKCTYEKSFGMWQNADNGVVDGINGLVDTNLAYYNFPQIIEGMRAPKVAVAPTTTTTTTVAPTTTTTTTAAPTTTTTTTVKPKSIDELAHEVIAGKLGNGDQRKAALGAQYDAVQARVAELLAPPKPVKSIDELAHEVIAGTLGNGDQRKAALGAQYDAVQARVAELLAPKPAVVAKRNLSKGETGEDVKELQVALNKLDFKCGNPDGSFGPATLNAVERFQSVYLPHSVDGVVGPATLAKINSLVK